MTQKKITRRLLLYEAMGFMILIAVSWVNELCDLPTLLFSGAPGHNWHEAALETVVILAAAMPTILLSRRLAKRLFYLEGFLRMCAWCRKIGVQDDWISADAYLSRQLTTCTTHSICPECTAKLSRETVELANVIPT